MAVKPLRIIFAGTPEFAATALQALIDSPHEVVAVYTQPDRRAGRGQKLFKSPVKQLAESQHILVYQPENLSDSRDHEEIQRLDADVMVVAAYGLILPEKVLAIPRFGCLNIHASLLPRWRGAAPIQRAIAAGDEETGVTIMQMDKGLDTGDMLLMVKTPIEAGDTGGTLHDKLANAGAGAIIEALNRLQEGELTPTPQPEGATYAAKLDKAEARINWNQPAVDIERAIRAFNPWPVAFTLNNGKPVRIFESEVISSESQEKPGTVLRRDHDGVDVQCSEGALRIKHLQLPGAKAMPVTDFINGGKPHLNAGDVLESEDEQV